MHRIIGVTDLQRRFRTILDEVVGDQMCIRDRSRSMCH